MRILVVTQHFWPENFRINDIVEGFVQDGLSVDVLCGLPNYPKGEWFDGYSADGPFEEVYKGARVFRAREIPRKGNTGKTIFLNYVSWPLYAAGALKRLPGGYDAVFCFNTSPVLMCWPAIRYAKKHHIPFTNYVLDLWPENLYSVLPVKNRFMRWVAQSVSDSLYRRCDRLIAMSGPLQERLCARPGKSTAGRAGRLRRTWRSFRSTARISMPCRSMTRRWRRSLRGGSTSCSPVRSPRRRAWTW